ncbi:MAG: alpha-E domain-containing protein [Magnetococcales bacterium]|nr:alpha-E domain-containing protein [Magnetococcales bacterium]
MLSRAADNIYWMARYVERAENIARLLDVVLRNDMLFPVGDACTAGRDHWRAPLLMTGTLDDFNQRYGELSSGRVTAYMILDKDNPASIKTAIGRARENARATRYILTTDLWESLNQTWLPLSNLDYPALKKQGVEETLEWVRDRSHLFRGTLYSSMRRGDGFYFARLGNFVERADNTARLLLAMIPSLTCRDLGVLGGGVDFYRAGVLLHALSAFKGYREIFSSRMETVSIMELLVSRPDMPQSLMFCLNEIVTLLDRLNSRGQARENARHLRYRLETVNIPDLMRIGMVGFLEAFAREIAAIANGIQSDFMLTP